MAIERIETPRLLLRPYAASDADSAFVWLGDAEVMRYHANGSDRSLEGTQRRIARYITHQAQHGFSKWILIQKSSGEPVGDAGLQVLPEMDGTPDLGFRLRRSAWGHGLGTEVAQAWCRVAFDDLQLTSVSAFSHVDNAASLRVLNKVGFQRQARRTVMGLDVYTYLLRRPATVV